MFDGVRSTLLIFTYRSTFREVFNKKDVFKDLAEFPGKHLCQSLCFNKITGKIFLIENECKAPYGDPENAIKKQQNVFGFLDNCI